MNATICPREDCHQSDPDPIALPDRETLAKAIHASELSLGWAEEKWEDLRPGMRGGHRRTADVVLSFLHESITCWETIDPADIKVGMRVRMSQGTASMVFVVEDATRDYPCTAASGRGW